MDTHAQIHTYPPTYLPTCLPTYLPRYIHTSLHTYMHNCRNIHAYIQTYIHRHASMHTCIHTYIHAYIHPCIHTYILTYHSYTYVSYVYIFWNHTNMYMFVHVCSLFVCVPILAMLLTSHLHNYWHFSARTCADVAVNFVPFYRMSLCDSCRWLASMLASDTTITH